MLKSINFTIVAILSLFIISTCGEKQKKVTVHKPSEDQNVLVLTKGSVDIFDNGKINHFDKIGTRVVLAANQKIVTADKSRLTIERSATNDKIELYANATLVISPRTTKSDIEQFTVPKGKARFSFKKSIRTKKQRKIKIRTTNAIIGIKGTDFVIQTAGTSTNLLTMEGVVSLASAEAPDDEVIVTANQISKVNKGFLPTKPVSIPADKIDQILNEDGGNSLNKAKYGAPSGRISREIRLKAPKAKPGNRFVSLRWNKSKSVDSYNLYWGLSPKLNIRNSKKIKGLRNRFTHKNLTNNKTYYYFLTPVQNGIEGKPSPIVKAKPFVKVVKIPQPTGLKTKIDDNGMILTWDVVKNSEGYVVYWSDKVENVTKSKKTIAVKTNQFVFQKLVPNIPYYFVVAAIIKGKEGKTSQVVKAINIRIPPVTPQQIKTIINKDDITITWESVKKADGYIVYWGEKADKVDMNSQQIKVKELRFDHRDIRENTSYYYKVAAYNADGISKLSTIVSAMLKKKPVPVIPANVKAEAGNGAVLISWDKVEHASGYYLYWSDKGDNISEDKSPKIKIQKNQYLQKSLDNGTTYYYAIKAFNEDKEGALSKTVEATPQIWLSILKFLKNIGGQDEE